MHELHKKQSLEWTPPAAYVFQKIILPHLSLDLKRFLFITILGDNKGHEITLELDGHKEGLLRDKFVLKNEAGEEFVIVLHARCIGLRKGTPMLKDNIRCIQHPEKEDEEYSDWQGFDWFYK